MKLIFSKKFLSCWVLGFTFLNTHLAYTDTLALPNGLEINSGNLSVKSGTISGQVAFKVTQSAIKTGAGTFNLNITSDEGFCFLSTLDNSTGCSNPYFSVFVDTDNKWKLKMSGNKDLKGQATCITWVTPS